MKNEADKYDADNTKIQKETLKTFGNAILSLINEISNKEWQKPGVA